MGGQLPPMRPAFVMACGQAWKSTHRFLSRSWTPVISSVNLLTFNFASTNKLITGKGEMKEFLAKESLSSFARKRTTLVWLSMFFSPSLTQSSQNVCDQTSVSCCCCCCSFNFSLPALPFPSFCQLLMEKVIISGNWA